jgi:tRNA modification GTPase
VLFLHDLTRRGEPAYEAAEAAIAARLPPGARLLHVHTKCDLVQAPAGTADEGLRIAAPSGIGLAALREALLRLVGWHPAGAGTFSARTRHVHALRGAQAHLCAALDQLQAGDAALELLAEELRLAHDALGEITGAFTTEDLLGAIFGRFCIGK